MGSILSSVMDENMKKQQAFMVENQVLMLKRQLAMQNAIRERQMAMQIARSREMLMWTGSFGAIVMTACLIGAVKSKNGKVLGPIVPISFILGYQTDLAFGSKFFRIRKEAESILVDETGLIELPHGMPDFEEVERRRIAAVSK